MYRLPLAEFIRMIGWSYKNHKILGLVYLNDVCTCIVFGLMGNYRAPHPPREILATPMMHMLIA